MRDKENALGRQTKGTGDTSAAASVSTGIIPPPQDNPTADEISEMCQLMDCLPDRLLVSWSLLLRDMTPQGNPRGCLFQQLLGVDIRRRKRNGGAS